MVRLSTISILFLATSNIYAAVIITVSEVDTNVVFSYSGTINLTGLGPAAGYRPFVSRGIVDPSSAIFSAQVGAVTSPVYPGSLSPQPSYFGTGGSNSSGIIFGDPFSVYGDDLYAPPGYVSGTPLEGHVIFPNQSITTLGIDSMQSPYTWIVAVNGDTITMNVIPEPSTLLTLIVSYMFLVGLRRRQGIRHLESGSPE